MINTYHYDEGAPIRIYVANLGKYNEGELVGGWLSLPASDVEVTDFLTSIVGVTIDPEEALHRELRGERVYEEYAIHDWESDFLDRVGEYESIDALNERAELIEGWNDYQRQTMLAAVQVWGDEAWLYDVDDFVLYDDVHSDYDLGYYWAVDSGCYELKEPLASYFDYETFGRDIRFDTDGGHTDYGFIELLR